MSAPGGRRWLVAAVPAALVAGAVISALKLAYRCRDPGSEACVWGKAYYPVALPLETVVFGLVILGVWALLRRRGSERDR